MKTLPRRSRSISSKTVVERRTIATPLFLRRLDPTAHVPPRQGAKRPPFHLGLLWRRLCLVCISKSYSFQPFRYIIGSEKKLAGLFLSSGFTKIGAFTRSARVTAL